MLKWIKRLRLRRWFRYRVFIQHDETGRITTWPTWKKIPRRWYRIERDLGPVSYPEGGVLLDETEES